MDTLTHDAQLIDQIYQLTAALECSYDTIPVAVSLTDIMPSDPISKQLYQIADRDMRLQVGLEFDVPISETLSTIWSAQRQAHHKIMSVISSYIKGHLIRSRHIQSKIASIAQQLSTMPDKGTKRAETIQNTYLVSAYRGLDPVEITIHTSNLVKGMVDVVSGLHKVVNAIPSMQSLVGDIEVDLAYRSGYLRLFQDIFETLDKFQSLGTGTQYDVLYGPFIDGVVVGFRYTDDIRIEVLKDHHKKPLTHTLASLTHKEMVELAQHTLGISHHYDNWDLISKSIGEVQTRLNERLKDYVSTSNQPVYKSIRQDVYMISELIKIIGLVLPDLVYRNMQANQQYLMACLNNWVKT